MALFYFHIDGDHIPDEGHELADMAEAKSVAARLASQMIGEDPEKFWENGEWTMTVSNEEKVVLFSLTFFGAEEPKDTKRARFGF